MKPETILDLFGKNYYEIMGHIKSVNDSANKVLRDVDYIGGDFDRFCKDGAVIVGQSKVYSEYLIPYEWLTATPEVLKELLQKHVKALEERREEQKRIEEVEQLAKLAAKELKEKTLYLELREKYGDSF